MGRASIYQDDHWVAAHRTEERKRLGGWSALHRIQADVWGNRKIQPGGGGVVVGGEVRRGFRFVVGNEKVLTGFAAVAVGPLFFTVVAESLFVADRKFLGGEAFYGDASGRKRVIGRGFRGEGSGRGALAPASVEQFIFLETREFCRMGKGHWP